MEESLPQREESAQRRQQEPLMPLRDEPCVLLKHHDVVHLLSVGANLLRFHQWVRRRVAFPWRATMRKAMVRLLTPVATGIR